MAAAELEILLRHIRKLAAGRNAQNQTDRQLLEDFSARRDQAAFAALVARHGPMVLRVCRRVLNHEHDAEDAFQATFLVLSQNSGTIRKRAALAQWLHGVAFRTAMKLKRSAARRRNHEAELRTLTPKAAPSPTWHDVQAVLDEEIQRLPDALQAVLVLSVLEGKSGAEIAAELGIKPGTVSSRLTRARQRLQQRLARRGIELPALLAGLAIADSAGKAVMPAVLANVAVRAGLSVAAGGTAAGMIPAHVAKLAAGVTKAMFLAKAKLATAIFLMLTLLAGGAGIITHQVLAGRPAVPQKITAEPGRNPNQLAAKRDSPKADAVPTTADAPNAVTFSGQVNNPAGKPIQNARVYLLDYSPRRRTVLEHARTDADGRYRFRVRMTEFDRTYSGEPWNQTSVLAFAEGYGLGVPRVSIGKPPADEGVTIQLAKDDMPILGRVIDLQGRPVAGVQVRVRGINVPRDGDMLTFIDALKTNKEGLSPQLEMLTGFRDHVGGWNLDNLFPPATTDTAGRFRIQGVGRERMADLLIQGPTIETRYVYAMTRPCERIEVPAHKVVAYMNPIQPLYTFYGATFDHVAAPSRPVVGVVRDKETGRPIPGAIVEKCDALPAPQPRLIDERIHIHAVTDSQGRYRITGLPWGANFLRASVPAGKPYVMSAKEFQGGPGLEPVTVDFSLMHGVWIDVQVTDKFTGKPVPCRIQYFVFQDNPLLQQAIGITSGSYDEGLAESGALRLVGLPGRGLVAVRALEEGYRNGVGAEGIQGKKGAAKGDEHFLTVPTQCFPNHFHAVIAISPAKGSESVACGLVLDPGRALAGTLVGPNGEPLAGALTYGLDGRQFWSREPLWTAEFIVKALEPGKTRRLLFLHQDKGLAGTMLLRGDEKGPLTLKLEPGGVVTGRLLSADGKPLRDVQILTFQGEFVGTPQGAMSRPLDLASLPYPVRPDKDGRFRMEGLVPGLKYNVDAVKGNYITRKDTSIIKNLSVRSGEIKDLGDYMITLPEGGSVSPIRRP